MVPSLFHATDVTLCERPFNVDRHVPVDVSHILTVLSPLPLATCCPFGLKLTHNIPLSPVSVDTHVPVDVSQIFTLLS